MSDRETAERNPRSWFAYDPVDGASFFSTEAEARAQADAWLDEERDNAGDGWSEDVEGICYGRVTGYVVQTKNDPAPDGSEFDYIADYALRDDAPCLPPDRESPGLVEAAQRVVHVYSYYYWAYASGRELNDAMAALRAALPKEA